MLNAFYTRIFISLLLFGRQLLENTRGPFVWFCVSLFSIWYLGTHTHKNHQQQQQQRWHTTAYQH